MMARITHIKSSASKVVGRGQATHTTRSIAPTTHTNRGPDSVQQAGQTSITARNTQAHQATTLRRLRQTIDAGRTKAQMSFTAAAYAHRSQRQSSPTANLAWVRDGALPLKAPSRAKRRFRPETMGLRAQRNQSKTDMHRTQTSN